MLKKYMRRNEKEIGSRTSGRMVEKPEVQMRYNWHRYFQKIWMFAGMLILSFLMQLLISSAQQSRIQQGIAGEVLRFHVLANSDSGEDQAVKLQVRDAVLQWMEATMIRTHLQAGLEEGAMYINAIRPQERKEEPWHLKNQIRISGSNLRKEANRGERRMETGRNPAIPQEPSPGNRSRSQPDACRAASVLPRDSCDRDGIFSGTYLRYLYLSGGLV